MSEPKCATGCGRPSPDAMLCTDCTDQLEQAIAELPAHLHDLELAAARQARVGNPPAPARPDEVLARAEVETRQIPAALRSKQGRITLPTTALPFAPPAADLLALAVNAVTTWVRHLCESRGVTASVVSGRWTPRRRRVQIIDNRWVIDYAPAFFTPFASQPIGPLCTWLVAHIDAIRQDEAAGAIHSAVTRLTAAIDATVDRRDPLDYYGRCDRADVRIEFVHHAGPLCWEFACDHASCNQIRAQVLQAPRVGRCGAELYGKAAATEVECTVCGVVYTASERKAQLRAKLPDKWARPQVIADALTELDQPVNAATLRKWIQRDAELANRPAGPYHANCGHRSCKAMRDWGKRANADRPLILQVGIDDDGAALYRVGDVQARIEWARKRTDAERLSA